MPILIDGNNLMHTLPAGSRSRAGVRKLTLDRIRHERVRVYLVFDGPAPDNRSTGEELGQLSIVFSGQRSADDVIMKRIPRGGSAADWTVITNDRELLQRARSAGARVRRLDQWGRSRALKRRTRPTPEAKLSSHDIDQWETFFAEGKKSGD